MSKLCKSDRKLPGNLGHLSLVICHLSFVICHLSLVRVLSLFTFRNILGFFRTNLLSSPLYNGFTIKLNLQRQRFSKESSSGDKFNYDVFNRAKCYFRYTCDQSL
jgi:hypothetical protein